MEQKLFNVSFFDRFILRSMIDSAGSIRPLEFSVLREQDVFGILNILILFAKFINKLNI